MELPCRYAIVVIAAVLSVLSSANGFAAQVAGRAPSGHPVPDDPSELARTWEAAQVIVHDGRDMIRGKLSSPTTSEQLAGLSTRHPAIVYLHGCDGLDRSSQLGFWQGLAKDGYAVFMPDSFARAYRVERCGKQGGWTYAARLAEVDYALRQIENLGWVDTDNLVLYGHSEGGIAASRYRGDAFRGVIITGSSCNKYRLQIPALAVHFAEDRGLNDRPCQHADERLVLRGRGHEVLGYLEARQRIREFIHEVSGAGLEAGDPAIAVTSPLAFIGRHD